MLDISKSFEVENGISFTETNVVIVSSSVVPTIIPGIASVTGSLYLLNNGDLYLKTNVADTAWDKIATQTYVSTNYVSDAMLAIWPGTTNITTLGTISAGTWHGTIIDLTHGGTGLSTIGTANQLLGVNAGSTGLEYKSIVAGNNITITPTLGAITISASGTVQSVSLAVPAEFTVSNSPITTSGTITISKAVQAAHTIYAGPSIGNNVPTFRTISLTNGDLSDVNAPTPTLGQSLSWNGSQWVPIGGAGTGGGLRTWAGNIISQVGTTRIIPGIPPPAINNGTEIASQTVTPLSTSSKFIISIALSVSASTNNNVHTCAVFRNSIFIGGAIETFATGGNSNAVSVSLVDIPNSVAPVVYSIRYGTNANTWYINRRSTEDTYGGVLSGWQLLEF